MVLLWNPRRRKSLELVHKGMKTIVLWASSGFQIIDSLDPRDWEGVNPADLAKHVSKFGVF